MIVLDEKLHDHGAVLTRRPLAFRWSYAIDATRIHQTRSWVVF